MLRWIGLLFVAAGLAVLASYWLGAGDDGFRLTALGEWWFWASPETIQLAQPGVERHISPALWEHGIQPVLTWPLAVELFVIGAVLLFLGRRRRRRR